MLTISLNQQIGDVSLGEIILALVILAVVFGFAMAVISFLIRRDKSPNQPSELHARDRYAVAEQIEEECLIPNDHLL